MKYMWNEVDEDYISNDNEEERALSTGYDTSYENKDQRKELREAIQAGENALASLYSAKEELDSARGWGIFDMLGGGLITSMIKHSKMDRAQEHLEDAKRALRSFSRELRDVEMYADVNIDCSELLRFADWFFDGLAADWLMQNHINKSRTQVDNAIRQVQSVLRKLNAELERIL